MVALNFSVFIDKIESGEKFQTIRNSKGAAIEDYRIKVGDKLQIYTGMRTKKCRKILEDDPECILVEPIHIWDDKDRDKSIYSAGGPIIGAWHRRCYAKRDGFDSYAEMVEFFKSKYGLPFTGFLIRWRPNPNTGPQ